LEHDGNEPKDAAPLLVFFEHNFVSRRKKEIIVFCEESDANFFPVFKETSSSPKPL
jgi:hypothetical protein